MADGGSDVKGKKIAKEDDDGLPSLEKHLEGMTLQGEEVEDLDFSKVLEDLVKGSALARNF